MDFRNRGDPNLAGQLRILQINVRGSENLRQPEFHKLVNDNKVHVILAQETLLGERSCTYPGFEVITCKCHETERRCQGLAILIRRDLRAQVTNLDCSGGTDAQRITLWWKGAKSNIYNWYQPSSDKRVTLGLGDSTQRYIKTIIAGDTNGHHQDFGYPDNDSVGDWIVELTSTTNLGSLVKTDSPPTFIHVKGTQSRPDQAIISSDLRDRVTRKILEEIGSDHLPALITVDGLQKPYKERRTRWNFKKADWKVYSRLLDSRLLGLDLDSGTIDEGNKAVTDAILQAAKRCIPRGHVKRFSPTWSDELAKAVKLRQTARKAFAREPSARNRKKYNALCRRAKRLGQEARKQAWHSTCESLNLKTAPRSAWTLVSRISKKRGNKRIEPLVVNGRTLNTPRKEAEAFTRYYAVVATGGATTSGREVNKARRKWQKIASASPRTFAAAFTLAELEIAMKKMKERKAPGQDGIAPEMVKNMGAFAKIKLLQLFNRSWERGEIPKNWKTAIIIPILKKGKPAKDLASYRPISLTSVLSKTLERMVNSRLYHYLESNGLVDANQAGFRRFRSTTDQLIHFTHSVIDPWQSGSHTVHVAVFVDLRQAYDRVWRRGLLLKLQRLGVTGKMYWWIKEFLENRLIKTSVSGIYSSALPLRDGLPQGSSLSCTLFLFYVNDLSEFLQTQNRLAFADDIVIWQQAAESLNRELALLKRYCKRWRMQVNTDKTVFTVFSNSYWVLEREPTILFGDSI